jgi:hypothetical protein
MALSELLSKLGFSMLMLGPIAFISFILIDEYSKIIQLKVAKIFSVLNLIPIFTVWVFSTDSFIFFITLIFMVLNSLYVLYIQLRLIFISMGKIKRRFIQFFSGEVIAVIAFLIAAQTSFGILPIPTIVTFYLGVSILIVALLIIFQSITNFPPFYEFEWKKGIQQFLIINPKDNKLLFFYDFTDPSREKYRKADKQKELSSLKGIKDIINRITTTKKEGLNSIKYGEHIILLSESKKKNLPLQYALIVERDLDTYKYILRKLRRQFESFFNEILRDFEEISQIQEQEQLFLSFDVILQSFIEV